MASHTWADGRSRSTGQDRSATQIGKVFVSVSTSETGRRLSAKNVHTMLTLPATLRIHSVRERQITSLVLPATANGVTNTSTSAVRARATICQSQESFRAWALVPIKAKEKLLRSIHRKGSVVRAFKACEPGP